MNGTITGIYALSEYDISVIRKKNVAIIIISILFSIGSTIGYYYSYYAGVAGAFVGFITSACTVNLNIPRKLFTRVLSGLNKYRSFYIVYTIFIILPQFVFVPVIFLYHDDVIWALVGVTAFLPVIPSGIGISLCKLYDRIYIKRTAIERIDVTNPDIKINGFSLTNIEVGKQVNESEYEYNDLKEVDEIPSENVPTHSAPVVLQEESNSDFQPIKPHQNIEYPTSIDMIQPLQPIQYDYQKQIPDQYDLQYPNIDDGKCYADLYRNTNYDYIYNSAQNIYRLDGI